jgi:hypothetical protein
MTHARAHHARPFPTPRSIARGRGNLFAHERTRANVVAAELPMRVIAALHSAIDARRRVTPTPSPPALNEW